MWLISINVAFIFALLFIGYLFHKITSRNNIQAQLEQQENIDLISSVTSLFRGTSSEKHLILTLLKHGINSGAIFHDLYIFKPDGKTTQVDIVVATSVGIIVFEVKDYSGWIYGKGNQQKWTQVLSYGREKHRFYNPILQNKSHISQLQRILKENVPFYSVIVFYGNCKLQDISFIPQNTFVTISYRIIDVIDNILQNNPVADYQNKRRVVNILRKAVANGNKNEIEEKHINCIKDMLGNDRVLR